MTSSRPLLVCLALSACTWLSDDDMEARLDLDGDGVAAADDCDPNDGAAAARTDGFSDTDGDGAGDPLEPQTFCGPLPDGWVTNALDQCPENANLTLPNLWWDDADDDGMGNPDTTYSECTDDPGAGRAWPGTPDCDDGDATAGFLVDWFPDSDGDGFGDLGSEAVDGCGEPTAGFSLVANDACPDLPELLAPLPYHLDDDGDGYGRAATEALCELEAPSGYTTVVGDCDDDNPLVVVEQVYYEDDDSDGWGTNEEVLACSERPPTGAATRSGDCDDDEDTTNPSVALDICDGVDNDCDTVTDEDDQGTLYFVDADEDGYPSPTQQQLCAPEPGFVAATAAPTDTDGDTLFDCDDANVDANPGETEIYDEPPYAIVDNDCNPVNDRDEDGDGEDGYGGPDCNDKDPNIASFLQETYHNGVDDDCDLETIDDDEDGDGFVGSDSSGPDCDDTNPLVHPDAVERVETDAPVDDNCNGPVGVLCGIDVDGDGYGSPDQLVAFDGDTSDQCEGLGAGDLPVGLPGDCDDSDDNVFPGADERCDGVDANCDGDVDSRLVSLMLDGVLQPDPVGAVVPGTLATSAGEWLFEVCNTEATPIELNFDFGDLSARTVVVRGVFVQGGPTRPDVSTTAAGGPVFRTEGVGRLSIEGLTVIGDGLRDIEVDGGDVTVLDSDLIDAEVFVASVTDDADMTLASMTLDQSHVVVQDATVELDDVTVASASTPVVDALRSVAFLQDVATTGLDVSLVQADGSSVTSVSVSSESASASPYVLVASQLTDIDGFYDSSTAPIFDLDASSLTSIGSEFQSNTAELVSAVGGSSVFQESEFLDAYGPVMFDTVDHDVTMRDLGRWTDSADATTGARIQLMDGDLTLFRSIFPTCPPNGFADITNGDLEVEGVVATCQAEEQIVPLFQVQSGSVDIFASSFVSVGAAPTFLLSAVDTSSVFRTVDVTSGTTVDATFFPSMSVVDVLGGDIELQGVTIESNHCDKSSCTDGQEVNLVTVEDGIVAVDGVATVGQGDAFFLTGESELRNLGTLLPFPGSPCSGGVPHSHTGPSGLRLDNHRQKAVVSACGTDTVQDTLFGECVSRGTVVQVLCDLGSCTCLI